MLAMVMLPVLEPSAFEAVKVTVVLPTAVGIPEMTRVVALRVSPAGRAVVLPKDVGEFVALMVAVKFEPTVPLKVWAGMTGGVSGLMVPERATLTVVAFVLERVRLPFLTPTVPFAERRTRTAVPVKFPAWPIVALEE